MNNNNNLLHNNLKDNLLKEELVEYQINIDSDDRKFDAYPDPFNYVVTFKSLGRSIYYKKHNGFKIECGEIPETPGPVIMRSFKNVKYAKLDHCIISRYNLNRYSINHIIKVVDGKFISILCVSKDIVINSIEIVFVDFVEYQNKTVCVKIMIFVKNVLLAVFQGNVFVD